MASANPVTLTPAQRLAQSVDKLPGVGLARAKLFGKLGLNTVRDVLFFLPRDYQDLTNLRTIAELQEDQFVSVVGIVDEFDLRNTSPGRSILGVLIRDGAQFLRAIWFNQPFLREKFQNKQRVMFSGKVVLNGSRWEMTHPRVQWLDADGPLPAQRMLPIYPLTDGLAQGHLRQAVQGALDQTVDLLDEVLPGEFMSAHQLLPLREALPQIHFPENAERLAAARRRLVFQELLVLQLALGLKRQQQSAAKAPALPVDGRLDARIRRLFPFEFTGGQNRAIAQVSADLQQSRPMNRLVQGDVGSGKTVVALYAMLVAVAAGYQAALMAPTEALARQHAQSLAQCLAASNVRWKLLTGSLTAKQRSETLAELASAAINVVIGTQAIVGDEVDFAKLGVVVIDEQHKFGVRQRAKLRGAGVSPHYLVMTATPIPRTVAMTLFGDLDVTTIADRPPGRQKLHSYLGSEEERPRWWEFVRKELRSGRQAYVVAPAIDEGEKSGVSLEATYEALANGELEAFRLGVLHGRMTSEQQQAVLEDFRDGEIQVLIATSIVEVGIDVPNATLMTIEAGERFGLAQLHQLRGRITRGVYPGYCCVFAESPTDEARERLSAFVQTDDGFRLAELDFQLRGPGDLLGTRQHGLPPLRVADLQGDAAILDEARAAARVMLEADPGLHHAAHARLQRMVLVRYGKALDLGDVG